jgi:hypothetical protein
VRQEMDLNKCKKKKGKMKFEIASHLVEGQRKKSTDFFVFFSEEKEEWTQIVFTSVNAVFSTILKIPNGAK